LNAFLGFYGNVTERLFIPGKGEQPFSYSQFWKSRQRAVISKAEDFGQGGLAADISSQLSGPCPRVYVYNNLSSFALDLSAQEASNQNNAFGNEAQVLQGQPLTRNVNQYALAKMMWHRLLRDDAECREHDASRADLFFIPVFAKPKKQREWNYTCASEEKNALITEHILELEHFNEATACRHFFVIGKGHYNAKCTGWFYKPTGLLARTLRISYSYHPTDSQLADGSLYEHGSYEDSAEKYPNMFSVPYPSSFHWSPSQKELRTKSVRKILMLFLGSDSHGDTEVRQLIHKLCSSYGDESICKYASYTSLQKAASLKATSQFCLEPGGDSPWRKSISESVVMGCIPVTFSSATAGVAPWHWGGWRALGHVPVPRKAFLRGKIDLKKLLQSIPNELLSSMRDAISQNSEKWQYSVDDSYDNDAFQVTIKGLAAVAEENCKDR